MYVGCVSEFEKISFDDNEILALDFSGRSDGWMDDGVGGWMDGWWGGWVGGWIDGKMHAWMDACMHGWMDGLLMLIERLRESGRRRMCIMLFIKSIGLKHGRVPAVRPHPTPHIDCTPP